MVNTGLVVRIIPICLTLLYLIYLLGIITDPFLQV